MSFAQMEGALDTNRGKAAAALGLGVLVALVVKIRSSNKRKEAEKQGAYGKVAIIKPSLFKQLQHPKEVAAMLKIKFGGALGKGGGLGEGVEDLGLAAEDVEFCSIKLKQVSRSFAQVITYLPNTVEKPLRLGVAVFYLVLRALDTVEDEPDLSRFDSVVLEEDKKGSVDARLVAKQRLLRAFASRVTTKEAGAHQILLGIGEAHELELLEGFDAVLRVMWALPAKMQTIIRDITQEMGDGMADYVARELPDGTDDLDDFERYCHIVAGTVGDGLTQLFVACDYAPDQLVERRDLWDAMGSFLQRTNIIRDYLEDYVDGRAWWPRSVWSQYTDENRLGALADPSSIASGKSILCLNHMIADALVMLPRCIEYLEVLTDASVCSFCALPQVMAAATLAECYGNPQVFEGVVKIRKGTGAQIMLDFSPENAATTQQVRDLAAVWLKQFVLVIQHKAKSQPDNKQVLDACAHLIKVLE
eukprot:CAMPEP_0184547432 /NCGR_PEP_ID=MMETSP0199_2-20130426/5572_1 /TAXON_ID=1112570 /ORGANISM="Thraustochytrium sp., Strain LLF1b" /LENGTH=474 /DNA_ID=CAMNT_0026941925 /DNA_START=39 /DNA_END=1463 /DNA_ORIENTATION=-